MPVINHSFLGARRTEAERILGALDDPGGVRIVEVAAEPGMGKTWLLGAIRAEVLGLGRTVVNERCTEHRHLPLQALAGLAAGEPSARLAGHPDIVLLDDVHWADDASIDAIERLVHRPRSASPPLLVVAHRPRQTPARLLSALAYGAELGVVARVELSPLTLEESAELVERSADDPVMTALHATAGGVPLYLLALAADRTGEGIPERLAMQIRAEIRQLDPPEALICSAAAVLDGDGGVRALAAVAQLDLDQTRTALTRLTRRDLLRPADNGLTHTFRHPIVERVVYAEAPRGWLPAAHRRAARFLAAHGAPAERLAPHIIRSREDPDPDDAPTLRRAAENTLPADPESSITWLGHALDALPQDRCQERVELMFLLMKALGSAGRLQESRTLLHEMLSLIPSAAGRIRAECVTHGALIECLLGHYPEARALVAQELAGASGERSGAGPPPETATLLIAHGLIGAFDGHLPNPARLAEARRLARRHDDRMAEAGAIALGGLSDALTGRFQDAATALPAAAAFIDSLPDYMLTAHPEYVGVLAWGEQLIGRLADAQRHFHRAVAIAHHHVHLRTVLLLGQAAVQLAAGRPGETRRLAAEARALAECCKADHVRGMALAFESLGAAWTGRTREAVELAEGADEALHGRRFHWSVAAAMALSTAARFDGDPRRAATLLVETGHCDLRGFPKIMRSACYEALTAAAADIGESGHIHPMMRTRIADWAAQAEAQAEEIGLPSATAYARATRGHVARTAGDLPAALACYREAARLFAHAGMVHEQALVQVSSAACLTALGRAGEAEPTLLIAAELARRSGAAVVETRIALVRRDDARANAEPDRLSALTTRERQIASIAALGKRTREIAEELSLSPRTVDVHLTRIYRKLNINSRSALAYLMADQS